MRLLLDTHALIWWLADDPELSRPARMQIADPQSAVYVSAASAWEMSMKRARGRLDAPDDLSSMVDANGMVELPMTIAHAELAGNLPPHHSDPFDRMLVAQAAIEGLTLVTRDSELAAYDVPVLSA